MKIVNAKVYTENFCFEEKDFCYEGAVITGSSQEADNSGDKVWDASGMLILPGLIDLHFHGCMGYDFCDGSMEALEAIAQYEASHGITGIAPTSMPEQKEVLLKAFRCAAEYAAKENKQGAVFCGIHMEGPFFNAQKKGACDEDYLVNPQLSLYREYMEASGGLIKIVDVSPELAGALEFIRTVSGEKVVSVAHTAADYRTAREAFEAGAGHVTHLFNAMKPFAHRDTGVVGAAFDSGARVELIGDGMHISDTMIRVVYRLFGADKVILISDSILAAGLADGKYRMGKLPIEVKNGLAYLEDGTIAGAASNLFDNLRHVISCGVSPECAIRSATYNPAKELGVLEKMGTLEEGKLANFIVVNEAFELQAVFVKGVRYR